MFLLGPAEGWGYHSQAAVSRLSVATLSLRFPNSFELQQVGRSDLTTTRPNTAAHYSQCLRVRLQYQRDIWKLTEDKNTRVVSVKWNGNKYFLFLCAVLCVFMSVKLTQMLWEWFRLTDEQFSLFYCVLFCFVFKQQHQGVITIRSTAQRQSFRRKFIAASCSA